MENLVYETAGFVFIVIAVGTSFFALNLKIVKLPDLKMAKYFGSFLFLLSLPLIVISLYQLGQDVRYLADGQPTQALVKSGYPEKKFEYTYQYQTSDGQTFIGSKDYIAKCQIRNNCRPVSGENIDVEYLSSSPASSRPATLSFNPMMLLPFLFLYVSIGYRKMGKFFQHKEIAETVNSTIQNAGFSLSRVHYTFQNNGKTYAGARWIRKGTNVTGWKVIFSPSEPKNNILLKEL